MNLKSITLLAALLLAGCGRVVVMPEGTDLVLMTAYDADRQKIDQTVCARTSPYSWKFSCQPFGTTKGRKK